MALSSLVAASCCLLATLASGQFSRNEQFAAGVVEGFVSDSQGSDLKDCVGRDASVLHDVGKAFADIRSGMFAEGCTKLADALNEVPALMVACKASEADVRIMIDALKQIRGIKDLFTHISEGIHINGKHIAVELGTSAAAYQARFYGESGRQLGVALRQLVVARAAPPFPQPPYNSGMIGRPASEMTRAEIGDEIEVYWNLSPLYKELLRSFGGALGMFHTSVGFKNLRTGLNSTIEFAAYMFDATLVAPLINNTDRTLKWNNTGHVETKEGNLDFNYWMFRSKIATINSTTFNQFLAWAEASNSQFTRYYLLGLETKSGASSQTLQETSPRPQLGGFTCFDFAEVVMQKILELAGPCAFSAETTAVLRNDVYLVENSSTSHVKADPNSEEVFNFYQAVADVPDLLSKDVVKKILEIAKISREMKTGQAIYYDMDGQYWAYTPAEPYAGIATKFVMLPRSCPRDALLTLV